MKNQEKFISKIERTKLTEYALLNQIKEVKRNALKNELHFHVEYFTDIKLK